MATTVNNTTANSRITIIFDADGSLDGNGPAKGTGNTESDVIIDSKSYLNLRSHTEIPSEVHALQWNASTNSGHIEFIDNRENEIINALPQWTTNVIIRCEAEDVWSSTFDSTYSAHPDANSEVDDSAAVSSATSAANTARNNYLSNNNIVY